MRKTLIRTMPERPNTHTYVVVFWQTSVTYSVTRFGEISPLWQNFKSFWAPFWLAYYVIGKPLYLPTLTFLCYRVNFFAVKDQRLNNSNMVTLVTYLIGAPRFVRKHWVLIHRGFRPRWVIFYDLNYFSEDSFRGFTRLAAKCRKRWNLIQKMWLQ